MCIARSPAQVSPLVASSLRGDLVKRPVTAKLRHAEDLKFLKGEQCTVPTPYQVTVVELWAKWCGPCRQVFPHLTAIYKKRQDQGLSVVGVSIEDDPTLPDFVRGEGERMGYTVAVSTSGSAARLMERAGISGIPHAFIVDRGGKIVYRCHPFPWKSVGVQLCAE